MKKKMKETVLNVDAEDGTAGAEGSVSFFGRLRGREARERLGLDRLDREDGGVVLSLPAGTTALNPSFFIGLMLGSAKILGIRGAKEKYRFDYSQCGSAEISAILKDGEDGCWTRLWRELAFDDGLRKVVGKWLRR